jgi:hypothetical protein
MRWTCIDKARLTVPISKRFDRFLESYDRLNVAMPFEVMTVEIGRIQMTPYPLDASKVTRNY